jgi:hypothetical protein
MGENLKREYLLKIEVAIHEFPVWQVLTIPARHQGFKGQKK